MGSIVIGNDKNNLKNNPVHIVRGFFGEGCKDDLKHLRSSKKEKFLFKTGYTEFGYGYYKGKFIFVAGSPKNFMYPLPDFKITIHMSQWNSLKELYDFFVMLFGLEDANSIFLKGKILRADFWLDLEIPYNQIKRSLYRPGVSISEQIKSSKRSCYLGSRSLSHSIFYQRPLIDRKRLDYRSKQPSPDGLITRIEVRFYRKDVPFRNLNEYSATAYIFPFRRIWIINLTKKKTQKILEAYPELKPFFEVVNSEGLHHARNEFNKHRNFHRKIEPKLLEFIRPMNLCDRWEVKIDKFVEGFSIRPVEVNPSENSCAKNESKIVEKPKTDHEDSNREYFISGTETKNNTQLSMGNLI